MDSDSSTKRILGSELIVNSTKGLSLTEFQKQVGRFTYERATEFDTNETQRFLLRSQLKLHTRFGQTAYKIPSCDDLYGWILQDFVKEMQLYASHIKNSWESTGCSILLDGWEDADGRDLINVLVSCPKGTIYVRSADISNSHLNSDGMVVFLDEVLADVGIEHVVQIISHTTSTRMDEVGKRLMDKYQTIFWTVSAPYCLELMIEKLEMMVPFRDTLRKAKTITRFVHGHPSILNLLRDQTSIRDLVKPSKIRSILPFQTLQNMVFEKDNIEKVFLSSAWKSMNFSSTVEGKMAAELVADRSFWAGAILFLKAVSPLEKALRLVYRNDEPQLGYVYEIIDQAKEAMRQELKHMTPIYLPFWEAIDDIWNEKLHSPLHAAAYFLNPNLLYSKYFHLDSEVGTGVFDSIGRMIKDYWTECSIRQQLRKYQTGYGAFGLGSANLQSNLSPVTWWLEYGKEYPELQRFAIRILNQTCSGASTYQLKRRMAEKLLSNGRNQIEKPKLTDLTYVHYNLHLQNFDLNAADYTSISMTDQIDQDWIADNAQPVASPSGGPVNFESPGDINRIGAQVPSSSNKQ